MRGSNRTELMALPLVVVLLGAVFLVLAAAAIGAWAWILGGVLILAGLAYGIVAARRSTLDTSRDEAFDVERPHDPNVYSVLVVADGECSPGALRRVVEEHADGRLVDAFVVAPALSSRLDRITGDEKAYEQASGNLDATLRALATSTASSQGKLGSHDPVQAVAEALREFPADEILVPDDLDVTAVGMLRFGIPVSRVGV